MKGYNDKQKVLVEKIFKKMATFKVDQKRFEVIKESVSKIYYLFWLYIPVKQLGIIKNNVGAFFYLLQRSQMLSITENASIVLSIKTKIMKVVSRFLMHYVSSNI